MSLAWISLGALGIAIIVSCTSKLNVGVLAIVLAWITGVYFGGMKLDVVLSGFPTTLFVTLVGMTLLFTQAQQNKTLDKLAHRSVLICRGNTGLIPVMFFVFAVILASIGPGNIATAALLAPIAMTVAARAGIPAFLMAIMVGNGANAGSLSPFAPTGLIASGLMAKIGLPGREWETYLYNLGAHAIVGFAGYFIFGGGKLFGRVFEGPSEEESSSMDWQNWLTAGIIVTLVLSVIFLKVNVGMGAFAGAVILALARAGDTASAMNKMPWNVIVMVCGVSILTSLLEKTQGMDLFTELLARFSTKSTITGFIAFVTGVISVYSSTSGVVLPAFLPTVQGLSARLGGADPMAIATAINVGGHLVDVSPLSTIGALCIAAAAPGEDVRALFNKLLAWGFSMSIVGALGCWLFLGR